MGSRVAPRCGASRGVRARASWLGAATVASMSIGLAAVACDRLGIVQDPLRHDAIAALGPEDQAVKVGPRHRAGQPCGVCHSVDGNADSFTFAGTVYRDPGARMPIADIRVTFVDTAGKTFETKTNCVGNFYVKPSEFTPSGAAWVSVQLTDVPYTMESPIHREVSCTACHEDPAGPTSAGHVFLTDDDNTLDSISSRACGPDDEVSR